MIKFTEIGIDLGSKEIKIAQVGKVNRADGDLQLNHLKEHKSYMVDSKLTPYSEEYFAELKKFIKDYSRTFKLFALSLNVSIPLSKHASTMFLKVPSVSKKDLEVGIKFEAEQALALEEVKDIQFTWKILNEYPELNEYEVLLNTLDKKIVKSLSQFKTIQWRLNRLMLQPVVLERFAQGNDVIVDFGHSNTRIYMYRDGKLAEVDSVNLGGSAIESKIEEYIERNSIEEDEDTGELIDVDYFKKRIYVPSEILGEEDDFLVSDLSSIIKVPVNKLIEEVKRIVRGFELQNGIDIDNLYYFGELCNLKYFPETLESELDIDDTKALNIITKDVESFKYEIAGLVMMDPKLKDDTNFTKFIKANIDYKSMVVALLAVSISTGLAFQQLDSKYERVLSSQQNRLTQQETTISGLDSDIRILQDSIDENQRFIDKIYSLKNQKKWLSDILFIIPDITPTTVVIKTMNIVNEQVVINGYAADYSAIGFFSAELEKIGETKINLIENHQSGDRMYSMLVDNNASNKYLMTKTFKITLDYKGELLEH